jgi:hypothetical protein
LRVSGWRKTIFQPASGSSCYCAIGEGQRSSTPAKGGNQVTEIRARVHALKKGWCGRAVKTHPPPPRERCCCCCAIVRLFCCGVCGRSVRLQPLHNSSQHITLDVTGTRNNEKRLRRRIRFQGGWLHKQKRIKRRRQRLFLQELLLS